MAYAYLFDGSWEGLLTCIFTAFETKQWPEVVMEELGAQIAFGQTAIYIPTDPAKAKRVEQGIVRRLGGALYEKIWTAFLGSVPDKSTIIYRYVHTAMHMGRGVYNALAQKDVAAIEDLCLHIHHEAHLLTGFARFSKMENGVYYSRITPKNSVLPIIMPFFADRFSDQPMLVHDATHHLVGVYDLNSWYMVETESVNLPSLAQEELYYRRLWRHFYHTIAIEERKNHKLRRSNMPKRYWPNMTEFHIADWENRA